MQETFAQRITVKDEWESGGQRYRLVNLGAGPDELQTINPLTNDTDWRPETRCYVHGVLCSRIASLASTEVPLEVTAEQIDALACWARDLLDEQNGPPLVRREEMWRRAVYNLAIALEPFEANAESEVSE